MSEIDQLMAHYLGQLVKGVLEQHEGNGEKALAALAIDGLIHDTGERRRGQIVYTLTEQGLETLEQQHEQREEELQQEALSFHDKSHQEQCVFLDAAADHLFPTRPAVMPNADIDAMIREIAEHFELGEIEYRQ